MTKVLIIGAGAIGSFFGYLLSERESKDGAGSAAEEGTGADRSEAGPRPAVEEVALLGRPGHIEAIRERSLEVTLAEKDRPLSIRFRYAFAGLGEFAHSDFAPEVVIVTVKTYSLPAVAKEIRGSGLLAGRLSDSRFILLMNGMGNRERFDLPAARVYEGITSSGVVFVGDGKIELKGRGKTVFEVGIGEDLERFIGARLAEKGFDAEFAEDFRRQQWMKLLANAVINPITALTREKNGIVLSPHLAPAVELIVQECVAVAEKEGESFDELEVTEFVRAVAESTAANTSSMLQDVLRGRETEIDAINGFVIDRARRHGVEAAANEVLWGMVKAAERRYNGV
ncbi:ketopantoate reductase family protein [Candidatus Methanocrinis natronophilus]|uniref:2-dehydropantoate 2-reductase n=1 Tax=Candidatus Methanocrinis natronophilus TaxID=3033396 RepID=A0ABT5X5A6_9EURY|nr:2-dehydropantoate 2-reductase [Candidatus Methanocrinis natronophilus]MDF0589867.1 2-dehydropantoate 2-reductase [Candidatus Methanocrinis natronophilus]